MELKDAIAAFHSQKEVIYKGQITKIKSVCMPTCLRSEPAAFIELVASPVPLQYLDLVRE